MSLPFNKLSPAQAELLNNLSEEAGEIVVAIGKITRHGYESGWNGSNNRHDLETEIGDLLAIVGLLVATNELNLTHIEIAKREKLESVWEFMHEQSNHPMNPENS